MVFGDDDDLVRAASDAARLAQIGQPLPESVVSMLRAIASTRQEHTRHELARAAAIRAGELGEVALHVLKVAIFALAS